jgi:hypothetical protein
MRSTAADQPRGAYRLFSSIGMAELDSDAIVFLAECDELSAPLNRDAEACQMVGQKAFGVALRQTEHKGVGTVEGRKWEMGETVMLGIDSKATEFLPSSQRGLYYSHSGKHFQGAGKSLRLEVTDELAAASIMRHDAP